MRINYTYRRTNTVLFTPSTYITFFYEAFDIFDIKHSVHSLILDYCQFILSIIFLINNRGPFIQLASKI